MSDKLAVARFVIKAAVSLGVTKVVNDIIGNNTVAKSRSGQIQLWIGTFVLSSMICDHVLTRLDHSMDKALIWYQEQKDKMNEE